MNATVAKQSEDGLTLEEWNFKVWHWGEEVASVRLMSFKRWQRTCPKDETPWNTPPDVWRSVDLFNKNTIKETPTIPDAVLEEARRWILSKLIFETP